MVLRKKVIKNSIKYIYIPIFLVLVWLSLTMIQIILNDESLTIVKDTYSSKELGTTNIRPILKGEKRTLEFVANNDNLGIITINFNTYDRYNEDYLVFRIKESGATDFHYEAEYYTKEFTSLTKYPFGFPVIEDSKGKTYQVELESQQGTPTSSVALNPKQSLLSASYQFDKNSILNSKEYAINFLLIKFFNSLQNYYLVFTSSIYIYPLIFYFIWMYLDNKIHSKKKLKLFFLVFLITAIIVDIFFIARSFDLVFLIVSSLFIAVSILYDVKSYNLYYLGILLLCICFVLQFFNQHTKIENASAWVFIFFMLGTILNLYELKKLKA